MSEMYLDALIEALDQERLKEVTKVILVARSKNFSELARSSIISTEASHMTAEFDAGDDGKAESSMYNAVGTELLVLRLLRQLNDREKVIFLFQMLREAGYDLTHEDCAKTLPLTRERYMVLLRGVRKKIAKILHVRMK